MARDKRYYKRSGDSFYVLEHFDVADMFGRRQRPELTLLHKLLSAGHAGRVLRVRVVLAIQNSGRGVAHAPYLALQVHAPHHLSRHGVDGNCHEGLPRLVSVAGERSYAFGANAAFVIHSEMHHDVCAVHVWTCQRMGRSPPTWFS